MTLPFQHNIYSSKNVNELNHNLNMMMNDVEKWAKSNKMFIINKDKTKTMLVCSSRQCRKTANNEKHFNVTLNEFKLDIVCNKTF